jgi:2-methylcitrate dehydratase
VSQWKGLASASVGSRSLQNVLLAARGITGPQAVLEGVDGFMEALGKKFHIDWNHEGLELIECALIKKYNAEVHTQSVLEGILELRHAHHIDPRQVRAITIDVFKTAFEIVGGGKFGSKTAVRTKEDADHSLPYLAAVALLDGDVWPEQFAPERIARADVQSLLRKVTVRPKRLYTMEYPRKMDCFIVIQLQNGKRLTIEKEDYEGFNTRPMTWDRTVQKFNRLAAKHVDPALQDEICEAVAHLEMTSAADLASLLGSAGRHRKGSRAESTRRHR